MLRADDGEMSHAPAFLQSRPPVRPEDPAGAAPKPRRRRTPKGETSAQADAQTQDEPEEN